MPFGFTTVVGRPLSDEFLYWFQRFLTNRPGVEWHPYEAIHCTIANCTRPLARSVESEHDALQGASFVQAATLRVLVPTLLTLSNFTVKFDNMCVTGNTIILPSRRSSEIAALKKLLQGNRDSISASEAASALGSDSVLGIDKFSTAKGSLQPTVKLTLGDAASARVGLPIIDEVPNLNVSSIRLVFYRDRRLVNAISSEPLLFGSHDNADKIDLFFKSLGVI